MRSRVHIRMVSEDFEALRSHLCTDRSIEQFCFALGSSFTRRRSTTILINDLIMPEPHELAVQSAGMVSPKRAYQNYVYAEAYRRGLSVIDIHTHTHCGKPGFSGIDTHEAAKNASYIKTRFPDPSTMVMIVFNSECMEFSGLLYDRRQGSFRPVDSIDILGNGIEFLMDRREVYHKDERFVRHELIPGWPQERLERMKVAIVGLGGNGSWVLQLAASLGIGRQGWLYLCDPDRVEASNLPRIPYATAHDIGRLKVDVAAEYVHAHDRRIHVVKSSNPVQSNKVTSRLALAHLLMGCVDSHGPRKIMNDIAVRYVIPLIDLGCEIFTKDNLYQAVAQTRLVLPGTTGCLMCCGAIDPVQAQHDLLSDAEREGLRRHGYIHGQEGPSAPSVATLNALTASIGCALLVRLVGGVLQPGKEFISIEEVPCNAMAARIPRSETCPVCGIDGVLAQGDLRFERRSKPDFGKAHILDVQKRYTEDSE
ncbi:MAG: ThiF family adenylyltransferase [Kiritimatiellae bacterium]|nr:ThiF family adenylyltransferase [Kiritimatiellia bacterium]